jgi:putative addiction module component (TIGR02574 family)
MASKALHQELFRLSVAERLEILEALWDSIPEDDEALDLTPEQREDLDLRVAESNADPDGGTPWSDARERIRGRKRNGQD